MGRKEIEEGVKEKDWRLYGTDRSGKLVLDTNENYLRTQKKHVGGDKEVDIEEVGASEELLYQHSNSLVKIFGVGGKLERTSMRESERV